MVFGKGKPSGWASHQNLLGPFSQNGVMLKINRGPLDVELKKLRGVVEIHSALVRNRFDQDVRKSIASLVQAFWRDIARNPPLELIDRGILKPSTEQAKDYLRRKLIEA